ncbi:Aldo-keto reductase [Sergentomyia squamirostris]
MCELSKNILLNSGHEMPLIGLGTYTITDPTVLHDALDYALGAGYRHIDTATVYRNEAFIGNSLKILLPKYNLTREDLFITSKFIPLAKDNESYVIEAVEASLRNLQLNYLDLYLIHWPAARGIPMQSSENAKFRNIAWTGLISAQKKGLCRSIGVSNYLENHLKEVLEHPLGIPPAVNQVEWHPHHHSPDLLDFCRLQNIFLQAYSSLGGGQGLLTQDPVVQRVATKIRKSGSQVLLQWAVQKGVGVVPKARSKQHIEDNIALDFTIPEDDMKLLDHMEHRQKYAWDPANVY